MRYLERGGVRLAWNESGSGTPILLIMGHRYSSAMWYPLIEALGDRYRLIWFDNQGTGESGARKRTSVREMTNDALAVLDAAGVDSAHIYGVSMGGGLALEFGIRYPERARSLLLGCTMAKTADIPNRPAWRIRSRAGARPTPPGCGTANGGGEPPSSLQPGERTRTLICCSRVSTPSPKSFSTTYPWAAPTTCSTAGAMTSPSA